MLSGLGLALGAGLLRERGDGHAFAHDLMQAAQASSLPAEQVRLVHHRLALGAEAAGPDVAEIARHREAGGERRRAEIHWQALPAADPELAPIDRAAVLRMRWPTLHLRDDRPALQARAGPALTPRLQAQRPHTLSYSLFGRGMPQRALPYAERALRVWQAAGDRRMSMRSCANIGLLHSAIGEQPRAVEALEHALTIAREPRLHEVHREVANNLADEAMALSPHWVLPAQQVFLLGMRVQAAWQRGALGAARRDADTSRRWSAGLALPGTSGRLSFPDLEALARDLERLDRPPRGLR
ncbi:MAG: hypothetical protein RL227_1334 [Pseudomonadota bacterium]